MPGFCRVQRRPTLQGVFVGGQLLGTLWLGGGPASPWKSRGIVRNAGPCSFHLQGKRDELFITTKIYNDEHRPELARCAGAPVGEYGERGM